MNRRKTLNSIPYDLLLEIFSRLHAKSIARCRCVSRLWRSMLSRPYFTKLFLTRSSARPRLLFAVKRDREWLFFSSPQPQNSYQKSSLVVAADFHMKFSDDINRHICGYSSGLIHISDWWVSREEVPCVLCNPMTGQYTILPKLITHGELRSILGFDPIDKQHKVLLIDSVDYNVNYVAYNEPVHYIMTLGTEQLMWRKIQCPLSYRINGCEGICINGVFYYLALRTDKGSAYYGTRVIVCFDVRSEKFKFIEVDSFYNYAQLMNFKGKLGAISLVCYNSSRRVNFELHTWVLEDVEKHEWSKCVYYLWTSNLASRFTFSVVGVTATGEIVLSKENTSKPFYVLYFNPERNTLQHVGILCNHEAFENANIVYTFVDHVEDLKLTTYAATFTSSPEQKCKPKKSTSTSYRNDRELRTSKSSRKDNQLSTSTSSGNDQQQDGRTFENINKFEALRLLDVDEFTGVKTCECDTSHLQVSCKLLSICWLVIILFFFWLLCLCPMVTYIVRRIKL